MVMLVKRKLRKLWISIEIFLLRFIGADTM